MERWLKDLVENKILITRGDEFDIDFENYYSKSIHKPIQQKLRNRIFTVKETDVAYRVISHWDSKGLFPKQSSDSVWHKFSLIELVWLRVVQRLRNVKVPIEKIAKARKNIMVWNKALDTYPLFEYFVVKALVSPVDPYVFMLSDGKSEIISSREFEAYKSTFLSNDAILISIKSVLKEMGFKPVNPETLIALTEEEIELMHSIRHENNSSIEIKITPGKPGKSRKIKDIKTLQIYPEKPKFGDIEQELKDSKEFAEVILKYEEGRRQSAVVKRTIRFK